MERHFAHDLDHLQQCVLRMASHAESALVESVEALSARDDQKVRDVRNRDQVIDRLELEIDELALSMLARAPLASDLRLVAVAMKISQNLERVGDEATKIAKRVHDLNGEPPLKTDVDIPGLRDGALGMLKAAMDAFVQRNPTDARDIIERDKAVNELNRRIQHQLIELMLADRDAITRCLHWSTIAKALERIADHATNIAEEVVYLAEAVDIRHAKNQAAAAATA